MESPIGFHRYHVLKRSEVRRASAHPKMTGESLYKSPI
jgi:hypothetical protein